MKIRLGFVSNSSSSSFLIGLKKKPETIDEMAKILFPGSSKPPVYYDNEVYSKDRIARSVLNQIDTAIPLYNEEVIAQITTGVFDGCPKYEDYNQKSWKMFQSFRQKYGYNIYDTKEFKTDQEHVLADQYEKQKEKERQRYSTSVTKAAENLYNRYKDRLSNTQFFRIEYADNDGSFEAYMEHADVFDNIPCIRISNH